MTDLRRPTLSPTQDYFTSREIADLVKRRGLTVLPSSERGVRMHAERSGWNDLPARMSRWRGSDEKGGRPSREYHLSILPEALQCLIDARSHQALLVGALDKERAADLRKMAAIRASALSGEARKVMEARAEVLTAIEGFGASQMQTRAWAIGRFLEAQAAFAGRQDIEAKRDRGAILTEREVASLARPLDLTRAEGFGLDPARLLVANDRMAEGRQVSERTIWRWFKARDERGVTALAPVPPKEAEPIPAAFQDFLRHYAKPAKPSAADAYQTWMDEVASPGLHRMPLSLHQVRRILNVRLNAIEKNVGREGLLTLRSRLAYVTRTTEEMWPTTIYTADGKTFDAEIADPVTKRPIRPEITTVMDVVTRKVVGLSLARSENQRSVAEALRNACVACGIPAIFYVDRGPGYRNEAMDADVGGLMGRLSITKMHAAPYGSQAKGRIERPQATIWDTLAKRFPSYMGRDMDKEAGKRFHKVSRLELKEFGESRSLPSWEEFVAACLAMATEYNAKPHRGLPKFEDETGKMRHMSPDECWAAHAAAGFEPVPVDPGEADDLFRPYEVRVARRALVQWNGNSYFDQALEAWHEERVAVGYDYHQADRVWVREFEVATGQPGRLICVARFAGNAERYVPYSYEQKALETRAKGRLARLARKTEAVEAEMEVLRLVDQTPVPMPDFAAVPKPDPVAAVTDTGSTAVERAAPRRRVFESDEELAEWAMAHPTELTASQIAVLKDCLARPAAREFFRMSGIDVEALRTLLRAAA